MDIKGRYGRRFVSSFFFMLVFLLPAVCSPQEISRVDLLVEQAISEKLYEDEYWLILLHYKQGILGFESKIDDPDFFISEKGKNDPLAELEATLRSFFQDDKEKAKEALCRFTARYFWLKKRLGFDASELASDGCEAFDATLKKIKPASVALVFPTAYINSPASMFGHTLVRIDSAENNHLLSHAVNYAATGNDINGILFAFKGIFGLYEGHFSILPYYQKVKEYGDIDHRDMWEYQLNLTEEEIYLMLLHLWELQGIYSDYFFFNENCAYTLLFLLDAARPSLNLTDGLSFWVMPIDTIRLMMKKNLIEEVMYRPSKSTKIQHLIASAGEKEQDFALQIYDGTVRSEDVLKQNFTKTEKARVLDLVMEYSQYKYSRKELEKEKYFDVFLNASKTRSRIKTNEAYLKDIRVPIRPEKGHKPNRLGVGLGVLNSRDKRYDDAFFQEIRLRPAYYDLLSNDLGYVKGAQIKFMDLALRYFSSDKMLRLEKFDILNIISISERDRFFKPVSWKVNTGLYRKILDPGRKRALFYQLACGGGYAWKNDLLGTLYVMADAEFDVSGRIKNSFTLGVGGSAGLLKKVSNRHKINVSIRPIYFMPEDTHVGVEWKIINQVSITTNTALSLELSGKDSFGYYESSSLLCFQVYF
jgi:hypothetical protein